MNGKYKVMLLALLAVFVFSVVVASGASAHEWLTLSGVAITKTESATTSGQWRLVMVRIPALEGGGEVFVLCDGRLDGSVGVGGVDAITSITNLLGLEENKLKCEVNISTNSICKTGTKVVVEPSGLPWASKLVLLDETLWDDISSAKEVGYSFTCAGVKETCSVPLELSEFFQNLPSGAEFLFEEDERAKCTFGEGFIRSTGVIVEKFLAS